MALKALVGSGDRIARLLAPFVLAGVALALWRPEALSVGGPPQTLRLVSIAMLVPGIALWLWSIALILLRVPRGELITSGPFRLVKHPLYTSVALLVLPWAGFLLDSWLGAALGLVLYAGTRLYASAEERALASAFGPAWDTYTERVWLAWM